MFDLNSVPIPDYTRKEDIANSLTHAVGVPLCIAGGVVLLKNLVGIAPAKHIVGIVLYIVSTLIVFLGSAIYHGLRPGFAKKVARVLDHSNIFLMISGMLTAFSLADYAGSSAGVNTVIVITAWSLSAVGIFLTFMDLKKFNTVQVIMYVIMGWSVLFCVRSVYQAGDDGRRLALAFLAGGICITLGTVLYFIGKKKRYFHAVFHVFVLLGNIAIYIGTYNFNSAVYGF